MAKIFGYLTGGSDNVTSSAEATASSHTHVQQRYNPIGPPHMRITMHFFLSVEYVCRIINTRGRIGVRPFIDDSRVVHYQDTAAPQKRSSYQRAQESTNTIREVKSLWEVMVLLVSG